MTFCSRNYYYSAFEDLRGRLVRCIQLISDGRVSESVVLLWDHAMQKYKHLPSNSSLVAKVVGKNHMKWRGVLIHLSCEFSWSRDKQ